MDTRKLELSFEGISVADANRYAAEIEDAIRATHQDVQLMRQKADPNTQDLGAIIGVVITSAAAVAVAQGIADWLRKRRESGLVIKADGEIIASGLTPESVLKLAEILMARRS